MPSVPSRLATLALALCAAAAVAQGPPRVAYPPTPTVEQIDVYHGVEVADPYRWLEEDVRESERVRQWVAAQNEVTFGYLGAIPERPAILRRLTELWDYEKHGIPAERGGRYFFSRNHGLQNQSVVYTRRSLVEEPEVLFDPNGWSEDGTVTLAGYEPSPDGRHVAYGIAEAGSDWSRWKVRDLESGEDLPETLEWIKFSSFAWTADGEGFFYSRFPPPEEGAAFQDLNLNQKLYYHRAGTPQAEDVLVFARPEQPEWGYFPAVTEDGRYLVITGWKSSANQYRLWVKDLAEPYAMPVPLVEDFANDYGLIGNDGPVLYLLTDLEAPRKRVIAVDLRQPEPEHWREVLPQAEATLVDADLVGNLLIAQYLEDARSVVKLFTKAGAHVRDVELPGIGSAKGFAGEAGDSETFYSFSSFATPPRIYRYDVATGASTLLHAPDLPFDPDDFVVEQVFYTSKDGTRVPMFVSRRKTVQPNGENPTLLYGYGGFNVSRTPFFSAKNLAWMEMGGIYAVANIRGGGEYGEEWHEAGIKLRKQNVFDDFIAAGEHLVASGWTRPDKLAVQGGSNGGLLVGAVVNQRPDLFGAALPAVGVMDMLRFHRFTAGRYWVSDYGSAEDPEEFRALHAYSPYHNLKPGTEYPAILVTTADTDDRVVPGHSFKYTARLQQAQAGDAPVLIRIETRAGHGAGKPTTKQIEEAADAWAFLAANLDLDLPPGYGTPRAAEVADEHQ